ncbi:MAG TPA: Xaa-Pro peptidase family protein [Thermotogota bacterium]|nr:Xaa-Pro peptidase family protein [Thermotogota bacterium]HRW93543.1 Xaa-Pro peptidase family protein [Thermotogota bacterium]
MKNLIPARLDALQKKLDEKGIDALVSITFEHSSANPRYLSNFSGSCARVVVSANQRAIVTDSRYWGQTMEESPLRLVKETPQNMETCLAELLEGSNTVGFEAKTLSVEGFEKLQKQVPGKSWVPVDDVILELRSRKHPDEVAQIREAGKIAFRALEDLFPHVRAGKSERELAAHLEYLMLQYGAEEKAFSTIFASGPRGALPHGMASDKEVQPGELIVIDFGCQVNGYRCDITRTIALGEPGDKAREVYQVVQQAQQKALDAARAGITGKQLDAVARDWIDQKGYGAFFGHGLGHGLGLETHEGPSVSFRNDNPLPTGAVVTIEPGIYLAGELGVRIEDDVYLLESGMDLLTRYTKELIIL